MSPILNYTTSVAASKTQGEVTQVLARRSVTRISTLFDPEGNAKGLSFEMTTPHGVREFSLPVNVEGVLAALRKDPKTTNAQRTMAHAEKVAWRILKDWLEAQVALIDAEMASLDEVMLPYLVVDPSGQTMYGIYRARELAAIEAGGAS
jgi:hypothetical protein